MTQTDAIDTVKKGDWILEPVDETVSEFQDEKDGFLKHGATAA